MKALFQHTRQVIETQILRRQVSMARKRGLSVTVKFQGIRLAFNPDDSAIYHMQNSLPKLQKLVDVLPRDTSDVLDIGANCGHFAALVANRFNGARIVCFEPSELLLPALRSNVSNIAVIEEKAVCEIDGNVDLYVNKSSQQTNSLEESAVIPYATKETLSKLKVESVTLDNYCRHSGIDAPDVVKIDVQGAESRVFEGGMTCLKTAQCVLLEASWLDPEFLLNTGNVLKSCGFRALAVINPVLHGSDIIATRDPNCHPNKMNWIDL